MYDKSYTLLKLYPYFKKMKKMKERKRKTPGKKGGFEPCLDRKTTVISFLMNKHKHDKVHFICLTLSSHLFTTSTL